MAMEWNLALRYQSLNPKTVSNFSKAIALAVNQVQQQQRSTRSAERLV